MTTPQALPTGTITFLFTDIEGSTRLLETLGEDRFREALTMHNELLRQSVDDAGVIVRTIGDAFFVVFSDALAAVDAAATAQRSLHDAAWPDGATFRVRMGLHTGSGVLGGDDYVGLDVHRAARIADAGHGGQILVSAATTALVSRRLPSDLTLRPLGGHGLKDLSEPEPIHQLDVGGLPTDFPPLRTIDLAAGNLPIQLTSFVGRSTELAEAKDFLDRSRLITLTGPGGTGKTRLATQLAAEVAAGFADGAFFVPLESITDADLVPPAILESLGLVTTASGVDPADHLAGYLADKEMLVVLDNLEQIQGAASDVSMLLAAAPDIKIIVTSRAPLHVSGEQDYPVPPLSIPDPLSTTEDVARYEGVELFTERALSVRPDLELSDDKLATIAKLTARLDGLPLAIELAASRVNVLTPDAILDRLSNRLLANPAPDLPERQQTIANTIGWSYDLLEEPVRRLFENCSVFIGGATLDFVERIAAPSHQLDMDVLDGITALIDHSLLHLAYTEGESRYQMLVVVREFAYAALVARAADDELRRHHAIAYAELAAEAEPFLLTSQRAGWLNRLTAEHDNLRAALDWAIETANSDLALQTVANLWRFWQARGHLQEAQERIDQALDLEGGKPRARAFALEAKGGVAYWQGRWADALGPYEQALELLRDHGNPSHVANALYNASFSIGFAGDIPRAETYLDESLSIAEAAGDRLGVGRAHWGMSDQASYRGDKEAVIRHARLAEEIFEELDAPFDLGWSRFMLAQAHYELGDHAAAREYHADGLRDFASVGDQSAMVLFLYLKAGILIEEGKEEVGGQIFGAVEMLKIRSGAAIADIGLNQYEAVQAMKDNPSPTIQDAVAVGKRMTLEEAVDLAVSS